MADDDESGKVRDSTEGDRYGVAFILDSTEGDRFPNLLANVSLRRLQFDPEKESPAMLAGFGVRPAPHWYQSPGAASFWAEVSAADSNEAVRLAWTEVLPAVRALVAYEPYPLGWDRPHSPRSISPTGQAIVMRNGQVVAAHRYRTWTAISMSTDPVGNWQSYHIPFVAIVEASNRYFASQAPEPDKNRVMRSLRWFEIFKSSGEYAPQLLAGWHALLPLVIEAGEGSGAFLDRLGRLAKRHGGVSVEEDLKAIRAARNEIAHEASLADADPLSIDSKAASAHFSLLRRLFLMALLFILESQPHTDVIAAKWLKVADYKPSIVITDEMVPLWLTVPEVIW